LSESASEIDAQGFWLGLTLSVLLSSPSL